MIEELVWLTIISEFNLSECPILVTLYKTKLSLGNNINRDQSSE